MNKLFLLFSLIALIGCAGPAGPTKAEIWNARIGMYTYAEAVGEFGPPDNKETLDEDVLVASWVTTKKNSSRTSPVKNLVTGEVITYRTTGGGIKVKKTILTFGSEKKLQAWKFRTD